MKEIAILSVILFGLAIAVGFGGIFLELTEPFDLGYIGRWMITIASYAVVVALILQVGLLIAQVSGVAS